MTGSFFDVRFRHFIVVAAALGNFASNRWTSLAVYYSIEATYHKSTLLTLRRHGACRQIRKPFPPVQCADPGAQSQHEDYVTSAELWLCRKGCGKLDKLGAQVSSLPKGGRSNLGLHRLGEILSSHSISENRKL
jgi:hypothetical protein